MKQTPFILVAEDDIDDRQLLQSVFNERKYTIPLQFVQNGIELIQFLDSIKDKNGAELYPNFILLDLNMPKMDGRQALEALKKDPSYRKIPVIVFSTTRNESEINRCYELGANTYVIKPSNYHTLLENHRCNQWLLDEYGCPAGCPCITCQHLWRCFYRFSGKYQPFMGRMKSESLNVNVVLSGIIISC